MIQDEKACGCCEGIEILTPQTTANRPGLEALAYRAGTYASFLETMKARLSTLCLGDPAACEAGQGLYPLHKLTTREAGDPAIALLDAWAALADVLTFYQERIANEGYLVTATERRSILELARLVGYRLRPGVAASTYLAFSLENGAEAEIPAGTRAQSLPGPGELPQSFETRQPLLARADWNELKLRMTQPQIMKVATHTVYLKGLGANLEPNDPALVVVASTEEVEAKPVLRRVLQIEPEPAENRTKVLLVGELNLDGLTQALGETPPCVSSIDPPPAPGGPVYPTQNAEAVPTTKPLTLEWEAVGYAEARSISYQVEFAKADKDLEVVAQDITATKYEYTGELDPGTTYHWRITALADGCPTPSEDLQEWSFKTAGTPSEGGKGSSGDSGNKNAGSFAGFSAGDVGQFSQQAATAADGLVKEIWGRLKPLRRVLQDPNRPADRLENEIRLHLDPLAEAKSILESLEQMKDSCQDFSEVIAWLDPNVKVTGVSLVKELNDVIYQLPVRRAVPRIPGRIYPGEFIDPSQVVELINHRSEGEKTEFDSDDERVTRVAEPGLRRLLDHLKTLIEDTLLKDSVEEDDKILAIYQQVQEVEYLQSVFLALGIDGEIPVADGTPKRLKDWIQDLLPQKGAKGKLLSIITPQEPSTTTVPRLITPLLKTPSLPPANALRLVRTIGDVFALGTDIAPRLLTTFQRQLQDIFYQALAEADAKPLPPEQGFEVLRVKAAPFGAKAPFKPVHDSAGVVIGHKEWLLFGLGVHISFKRLTSVYYSPPVRIQFLLTQDAETRYADCGMMLDASHTNETCSLRGRDITVELETTEVTIRKKEYTVVERITIEGLGNQSIELSGHRAQKVKIGDHYEHEFLSDEIRLSTINGDLVTIATSSSGQHPTLLIDSFSAPLPADMQKVLALDAEYDQISRGGWVVIEWPADENRPKLPSDDGPDPDPNLLFRCIDKVATISKPGYGEITQLTLDKPWLHQDDRLLAVSRKATIYTQSERLALASESLTHDVGGSAIRLDGLYDGLEAGRWLIVSGERTDIPGTRGVWASELVMLAGVLQQVEQTAAEEQENEPAEASTKGDQPGGKTKTIILLARDGLHYQYKRDTVTIYGNVVSATHGETRQEVLGSGDGSQAGQTFTLRQAPLTYLAAATPTGAQSTLELRVNGILWHEADNLIWLDANERGYITRADDQEQTTLVFGDGQHGARLPTGLENVTAVYRTGIGKAGNVEAERISLLATRPLGVKGVINPLPATGGADRERRDQARRNAPLAVMALDRLVSIQDYADFARAYAGIDKAHAVRVPDGRRELILLSIAGADDIPIGPLSDLYQNLCQALSRFGAPNRVIQVLPRELVLLIISANLRLHPDYEWERVVPTVRTALLEAFSFEQRQLGQDVLLSEVVSTIQSVPGVSYVDVDFLDGISEHIPPQELQQLAKFLTAKERIRLEVGRIQTAHVVGRGNETLSSIAQRYGIPEVELRQLNPTVENPDPSKPAKLDKWIGTELVVPRRIRPAQLAYLSPDVPDTLILTERT
jgi:hypothetical protein